MPLLKRLSSWSLPMPADVALFLLMIIAWGLFQLRTIVSRLLHQVWLLAAVVYRRQVFERITPHFNDGEF